MPPQDPPAPYSAVNSSAPWWSVSGGAWGRLPASGPTRVGSYLTQIFMFSFHTATGLSKFQPPSPPLLPAFSLQLGHLRGLLDRNCPLNQPSPRGSRQKGWHCWRVPGRDAREALPTLQLPGLRGLSGRTESRHRQVPAGPGPQLSPATDPGREKPLVSCSPLGTTSHNWATPTPQWWPSRFKNSFHALAR